MPRIKLLLPLVALVAAGIGAQAVPAAASTNQDALFQDGPLLRADPVGTLSTLKSLGVSKLRLLMAWNGVAPRSGSHRRPNFKSTDPSSYPASGWRVYDTIIKTAAADGISVDLDLVGPAPLWATGRGNPPSPWPGAWRPSAKEFGAFARAVGTRYSGHFQGLPKVTFWTIWNEPNYGPSLAPQEGGGSTELSPGTYRGLVDASYAALQRTGHGRDRFVIGETAPHGFPRPGVFGGMTPVRWVEALYCVNSSFRQFRGSAAGARGCPTTGAGSRSFRSRHPGLFKAGGFSVHPYANAAGGIPPNTPARLCGRSLCRSSGGGDPGFADLPVLPRFERILDRLQGIYGSRNRMGIWSTEYGYQTTPPSPRNAISPALAAAWINWAEYLSYKQPRIQSYAQYLLRDVPGSAFASGLELPNGSQKPTYAAYRMPIYMPVTSTRKGRSIEVWGCVRPAHNFSGTQRVKVQFGRPGGFRTVKTLTISGSRGYFDTRMSFSGSGFVRTSWTPPGGATVTSRLVHLSVR
jgi:hypothetical protein